MQLSQLFIVLILIAGTWGCGNSPSKENSGNGKAKDHSESGKKILKKKTGTKAIESQTPFQFNQDSDSTKGGKSPQKIYARFVKFSPSTSGSIFVFEDKSGGEHWFHKVPEAEGMDFVKGLKPMEEPEGYQDIWFKVTFENREVERKGEVNTEATILKVEKLKSKDFKEQDILAPKT